MNRIFRIGGVLALLMVALFSEAQEKAKVDLNVGLDIVNRYVWRGLQFSDSPNLQPYASVSYGGFSFMGFGSYATSKSYAEVDLIAAYTFKGLTFSVMDFYNEEEDLSMNDYFDWKRATTAHLVETSLAYELPVEKLPLVFTASMLVYGADLNQNGNQNLSSYFELLYPFSFKDYSLSAFVGATANKGYYAEKPAVVNTGLSLERPIAVSDSFSFNLNTSFIVNPRAEDVFLVVGLTF